MTPGARQGVPRVAALLLALLVAGCAAPHTGVAPHDAAAAAAAAAAHSPAATSVAARRAAILDVARAYAEHTWRAGDQNRLHGPDPDGVEVDTPDAGRIAGGWQPGATNIGVPYQWGGFSSLAEFDAGLAAGLAAGHLPASGASPGSAHAVGVDCSGFVSRCWDLPLKQSTRSLGRLCWELDGYDELLPGDLINSYDGHAVVFEEFTDDARTHVRVYEAGFPKVVRSVWSVDELRARGLRPMRYKPFDPRWRRLELSAPAFEVDRREAQPPDPAHEGARGRWRSVGGVEPAALAAPCDVLARAAVGDWVRYAVSYGGAEPVMRVTRAVSAADAATVDVQSTTEHGGKTMQTVQTHDVAAALRDVLVDFRDSGQTIDGLRLTAAEVRAGHYTLGGRTFPARQIDARLEGAYRSRGSDLPVVLVVTAWGSAEVPVLGLLRVDYATTMELPEGARTWVQSFEAEAFGRGAGDG